MQQANLKKKYGITDEEYQRAVDRFIFGIIDCSSIVFEALVDLITNGDISGEAINMK